jgi:hypothetical protein
MAQRTAADGVAFGPRFFGFRDLDLRARARVARAISRLEFISFVGFNGGVNDSKTVLLWEVCG